MKYNKFAVRGGKPNLIDEHDLCHDWILKDSSRRIELIHGKESKNEKEKAMQNAF